VGARLFLDQFASIHILFYSVHSRHAFLAWGTRTTWVMETECNRKRIEDEEALILEWHSGNWSCFDRLEQSGLVSMHEMDTVLTSLLVEGHHCRLALHKTGWAKESDS